MVHLALGSKRSQPPRHEHSTRPATSAEHSARFEKSRRFLFLQALVVPLKRGVHYRALAVHWRDENWHFWNATRDSRTRPIADPSCSHRIHLLGSTRFASVLWSQTSWPTYVDARSCWWIQAARAAACPSTTTFVGRRACGASPHSNGASCGMPSAFQTQGRWCTSVAQDMFRLKVSTIYS